MRIPLLLADFIHARACRPKCEKFLTRPTLIIENDKRYSDDRNCCVAKEVSILIAEQI